MYQFNFKRVEKKYLVTKELKDKFIHMINEYIEEDKFYLSKIHNIYFDTKYSDIIRYSLEKPVFKDKFRIRTYGNKDEIFLEIKTKYKGVVGKRRSKLTPDEFNKLLRIKDINKIDDQILKEFVYYYNYYNLRPAIYIAYDRESYIGKSDKSLRITFDSNLRSRKDNLYIDYYGNTVNYFDNDTYIMEIKTVGSIPLWLVRILSELKIFPYSFSKYGKIHEKEIRDKELSREGVKNMKIIEEKNLVRKEVVSYA